MKQNKKSYQISFSELLRQVDDLENDIYNEKGINMCIDNDELSPIEEGFMLGYINA